MREGEKERERRQKENKKGLSLVIDLCFVIAMCFLSVCLGCPQSSLLFFLQAECAEPFFMFEREREEGREKHALEGDREKN